MAQAQRKKEAEEQARLAREEDKRKEVSNERCTTWLLSELLFAGSRRECLERVHASAPVYVPATPGLREHEHAHVRVGVWD